MADDNPDQEVEHFDVFLSHSHQDADMVHQLAARLTDDGEFVVWLDRWVLVPGKHWQQEMARGIAQASCCAVFLGEETPGGWFEQEIQRALNRQSQEPDFRVIPVLLPGSDPEAVDQFLELRTWVDFTAGLDDDWAFHTLVSGIRGIPPGRPPSQSGSTVNIDDDFNNTAKRLQQLKELRENRLIDDVIAQEFQRKILADVLSIE